MRRLTLVLVLWGVLGMGHSLRAQPCGIMLGDSAVDLGGVLEGSAAFTILTVQNLGGIPLNVSTFTDLPFFSVQPPAFFLPPLGMTNVQVVFTNTLPFYENLRAVVSWVAAGCTTETINAFAEALPRPNPPAQPIQLVYTSDHAFRMAINQAGNPEPREWAIEVTPQGDPTTFLQADGLLGPTPVYKSDAEWMALNGGYVDHLQPATSYVVRTWVRSCPGSETGPSPTLPVTTHAPIIPRTITDLVISKQDTVLKFDWSEDTTDQNGNPTFDRLYQLHYSPSAGGPFTYVTQTALTSLEIANFPDQRGFFQITCTSEALLNPNRAVIVWPRPGAILTDAVPLIASFPDDHDTSDAQIFQVYHDGGWETLPDTAATADGFDSHGSAIEMMWLSAFPTGPGQVRFIRLNSGGDTTGTASTPVAFNQPPLFTAMVWSSAHTPGLLYFDASGAVDPDGLVSGILWDFGDGYHGWGSAVSHLYSQPTDTFLVTCTVYDSVNGQTVAEGATNPATETTTPHEMTTTVGGCGCASMDVIANGSAPGGGISFPAGHEIPGAPKQSGPNNSVPNPAKGNKAPKNGHRMSMNFYVHATLKPGSDLSCTHWQKCRRTSYKIVGADTTEKKYKNDNEANRYDGGAMAGDNYTEDDAVGANGDLIAERNEEKNDEGAVTKPGFIDWVDCPGFAGEEQADVEKTRYVYKAAFQARVEGNLGWCECTWEVKIDIGPNGKVNNGPKIENKSCTSG